MDKLSTMDMSNRDRLRWCILANAGLLFVILVLIIVLRDSDDKYFRFGPNEDLVIMSIKINTMTRYVLFQVFTAFTQIIKVVVNEIASPLLGFNIYNPDKKVITDFSKNELQLMANSMWLINGLTSVMFIMVSISQFDVAIFKVLYSELTCIYTVRLLLNEKEFVKEKYIENADEKADEKDNLLEIIIH